MRQLLGAVLWAVACSDSGSGGSETGGPSDACEEGSQVTWDTFGRGFVTQHCQVCHAGASLDRHGAPVEVAFDTEAQTLALSDRILDRAAGDTPDMPPTGGVSEDDRALLATWLACGQ